VTGKRIAAVLAFGIAVTLLFGCAQAGPGAQDARPTSTASTVPAASPTALLATETPPAGPDPTSTPAAASPLRSPTAGPTRTATAAPSPTACTASSRREEGTLRHDLLKLPMEYTVFLPPCYGAQPEQRYPVLYLIHGQNFNHDQWERLGADELAGELIAAGELPPFILVLPRDRSWAQPSEDPFGRVLVEALIPLIDSTYATQANRTGRAVGGLSRGASWALHLAFSHPDLFGATGLHSLPVFWEDTRYVRTWLTEIPAGERPRIFMDTGEKDYLIRSTLWFAGLLDEYDIPHEWYLYPGYHEEAYWSAHLEQYLRWYAADWQG
jgi:enterochelin esterase-like enzyme